MGNLEVTSSHRKNSLELEIEDFKKLGYHLVDVLATYMETIHERKVTLGEQPKEIRKHLRQRGLPKTGEDPRDILQESLDLMMKHSLHIGHPRFWGFICGSALPIGWLADFLASAINPNVGGYVISPMATEIERQTVQWLAEFVGYPSSAGGLLVSGGNMANMVPFWAARKAKADFDIRKNGVTKKMIAYVSGETHTWIQKAADLAGLGTDNIRWISTDQEGKMDIEDLEKTIQKDLRDENLPFIVVANAGSVSIGIVDPILDISAICKKYNLWMHADGAYGGVAAILPEAHEDLKAIKHADSIAIDPHKWLYTSLEAGCVLIKDQNLLRDAFSYKPPYYKYEEHEDDPLTSYYEYGPQNSRGFKALRVWMALRQAGREGYISNLRQDIQLAENCFNLAKKSEELEAGHHNLSICTFRYVPVDLASNKDGNLETLNKLNEDILLDLQAGGQVFLSNAITKGIFYLRICIVNHRTTMRDIEFLIPLVVKTGRTIYKDV